MENILNTMYYVKKSLSNLLSNKLRSFLTIGGISIGVLSVVVISSIGEVGKVVINEKLDNMGMDSVVISAEKSNYTGLNEGDLRSLKSVKTVENAMPLMNSYTQSIVLGKQSECMLWGVNEDADNVIQLEPIYGRLINRGDVASRARVCVVDESIAMGSYKRGNIVGKTIDVNVSGGFQSLQVVGVVKNGINLLQNMLGDYIPGFVYMPYTTLQMNSSRYYFDQIAVKLKDNSDIGFERVTNQLELAVKNEHEYIYDLKVENLLQQKSQLSGIMEVITIILSAIAGISLLVAGLSIMNVMLVSVAEQTREIGIKKAIGATNGHIMLEFLIQSILITVIGSVIGALFGIIFSILGCIVVGVNVVINVKMVIGIIAFGVLIGLIFGVYPARKAAALSPVQALSNV